MKTSTYLYGPAGLGAPGHCTHLRFTVSMVYLCLRLFVIFMMELVIHVHGYSYNLYAIIVYYICILYVSCQVKTAFFCSLYRSFSYQNAVVRMGILGTSFKRYISITNFVNLLSTLFMLKNYSS